MDPARIPAMQEKAKSQMVDDAAELARIEREREEQRLIEARRHPDELSPNERLARVRGVGEKTIEQLATGGYHTVEEVVNEKDLQKLGETTGIGIKKARQLKSSAENYLMEEAKLRAELNAERALMGQAPPTPIAPPPAQEAKV
jgi:N utilization substance protein A